MVQELESIVDQAVRVANRRRARLAKISLAGGLGADVVRAAATRVLAARHLRRVEVDIEDGDGPLRLVALEIEKGD